jgi:hypothetical protein
MNYKKNSLSILIVQSWKQVCVIPEHFKVTARSEYLVCIFHVAIEVKSLSYVQSMSDAPEFMDMIQCCTFETRWDGLLWHYSATLLLRIS